MSTNSFFNNYKNKNEQNLIDDLVIESIQIYGVDTFYVTKNMEHTDRMFNEDSVSIFNAAYETEMYISSVDGFGGEGDFLSKFGLQIRDQVTFVIAWRTFEKNVIRLDPTIIRPNEGDLIYMPFADEFFKIMHVEHESVFYQMGTLQVYELSCEFFEYSNERFSTGLDMIDNHYKFYKTDDSFIPDLSLQSLRRVDVPSRNLDYKEETDNIIDFSEIDPFTDKEIFPPSDYDATADDINTTADNNVYTVDLDDSEE